MYTKLPRTQVFRDPIYGYITVDYKLIHDLIDSKEVQRLRRIRQLAGVSMVFQTAEHSRFTHSLGAYQMANQVLLNVDGAEQLDEYKKMLLLCSALLHDIGHGPYSHAFESVMEKSHEDMTIALILSDKTEVNKIITNVSNTLANDIASVIAHDGRFPLIEALVSSQLDVDRMDYLSRDAYFTGASYGNIDYYRILRSMMIKDDKLVVRASGVHSIESYIMSRYHMYFQVYYHPTARSYESVLESIYERLKDLHEAGKGVSAETRIFENVIANNDDILSYIELDDAYVNGMIKQLTRSKDPVLSKLATAFVNRHLFKCLDLVNEPSEEYIKSIEDRYSNEFKKYYFKHNSAYGVAYSKTKKKTDINSIKVLLPNGEIKDIDKYSKIIKSLEMSSEKTIERIYYFED